jgi:hypothetical protein
LGAAHHVGFSQIHIDAYLDEKFPKKWAHSSSSSALLLHWEDLYMELTVVYKRKVK